MLHVTREFNICALNGLRAVPVNDTACSLPQVICTCPQEFNSTASLRKEQGGGSVWLWIIKTPHNGFHRKSIGMQYKEFKKQNPIWIYSKPYDFRDGGILDDSWLESQLVIDQCGVVFSFTISHEPIVCLFFWRSESGLQIQTVQLETLKDTTANYDLWVIHLALSFSTGRGKRFGQDQVYRFLDNIELSWV